MTKKLYSKDSDLFCIEMTEEEAAIAKPDNFRIFSFINSTKKAPFSFKRPFYLAKNTKALDIYKRIFAHVYKYVIIKDKHSFGVAD